MWGRALCEESRQVASVAMVRVGSGTEGGRDVTRVTFTQHHPSIAPRPSDLTLLTTCCQKLYWQSTRTTRYPTFNSKTHRSLASITIGPYITIGAYITRQLTCYPHTRCRTHASHPSSASSTTRICTPQQPQQPSCSTPDPWTSRSLPSPPWGVLLPSKVRCFSVLLLHGRRDLVLPLHGRDLVLEELVEESENGWWCG